MDIQRSETRNELLRIRCPKCFKLYSVDSSELSEAKPKFQCIDCEQKFWIPFPEALEQASGLIGFPQEWLEEPQQAAEVSIEPEPAVAPKAFQCPNCTTPYDGGATECKSCGIIFDKIIDVKEKRREPSASRELKELWDRVAQSYDDFHQHENFIAAAQLESALTYALYRYKQILEVNPTDDLANKAAKMLEALMVARVETRLPVQKKDEAQFKMPKLRVGTFIILLCGIVMAMGIVIPGARNLVGVGSAALFFVLALRYYFRVL